MNKVNTKEVGLRIKELRCKNQMTQVQLAEKLFYATERQLQRIESGEMMCPIDKLIEIAELFDTSIDYLLFGKKSICNRKADLEKELSNCICVYRVKVLFIEGNI